MGRAHQASVYSRPHVNPRFTDGRRVLSWDVIPVAEHQRVSVDILGSNCGDRHIGVSLGLFDQDGRISCGSTQGSEVWLWAVRGDQALGHEAHAFAEIAALLHSAEGARFDCDVTAPAGLLTVRRVLWRPPAGGLPGVVLCDADFSGLLVETQGDTRIYHANAGRKDDRFDELVFAVQLVDALQPGCAGPV